jgi:TetR/AcrR family tetracycline transcriptional repressor
LAYTEAFAVDEISGWLDPDDKADLAENLNQGTYPTLIKLIDEISFPDVDADFEFGLNVMISGLEAQTPEQ